MSDVSENVMTTLLEVIDLVQDQPAPWGDLMSGYSTGIRVDCEGNVATFARPAGLVDADVQQGRVIEVDIPWQTKGGWLAQFLQVDALLPLIRISKSISIDMEGRGHLEQDGRDAQRELARAAMKHFSDATGGLYEVWEAGEWFSDSVKDGFLNLAGGKVKVNLTIMPEYLIPNVISMVRQCAMDEDVLLTGCMTWMRNLMEEHQ